MNDLIEKDTDAEGRVLARLPGAFASGQIVAQATTIQTGQFREPGVCTIVTDTTATADGMWVRATPVDQLDELLNDASMFAFFARPDSSIEAVATGLRIAAAHYGEGLVGGGGAAASVDWSTLTGDASPPEDADLLAIQRGGQMLSVSRQTLLSDVQTPVVDLGATVQATTVTVTNTAGDDAVLPAVVPGVSAGVVTAAQASTWDTAVDLGQTVTATEVTITNTSGTNAVVPLATTGLAGLLSPADFNKLADNTADWVTTAMIAPGAVTSTEIQNGTVTLTDLDATAITNLGVTTGASTGTITNTTGTDANLPVANGTDTAGIITVAKFQAWDASLTVNLLATHSLTNVVVDAQAGGTNATIVAATTTNAGLILPADFDKLNGNTAGWIDTAMIADANVTLAKLAPDAVTNLSVMVSETTNNIGNTTGTDALLAAATPNPGGAAGLLTADDKASLDALVAAGGTDLGLGTADPATVTVTSSTGNDVVLPAATLSDAGVLTATDKKQLDDLSTGWFQDNPSVSGIYPIDGTDARFIRLNLISDSFPGITLAATRTRYIFEIHLNGFVFGWQNMSLHGSTVPPTLIDGQPNMVELISDTTNLFRVVG